jgi:hypothetical protein
MASDKIIVPCPTCKKKVIWSKENSFRPFCSERCKLIDLGSWAAEEQRIPDTSSEGKILPDTSGEDDESQ